MTEGIQQKKRWPWWLRLILYLSPLWIIVAIVLSVEVSGRRAYNLAIQEARDIGGPVTIEEIEAARKAWPDDENGALIISSLPGKLSPPPEEVAYALLPLIGQAAMPPLGEKWSEQTDRVVSYCLDQLSTELNRIDRLAEYKGGRFPLEAAANPYYMALVNRAWLRGSCTLKSLQVIHKAMHGDTALLARDLDIMLKHGQLLTDEPFLISSIVHMLMDSTAMSTLERVLAQATINTEQLRSIESLVKAVEDEDRLYWAIRGERAVFVESANWMVTNGTRGIPDVISIPLPANVSGMRGLILGDAATGVCLQNGLVRAKGPKERMQVSRQIDLTRLAMPSYRIVTRKLLTEMTRTLEIELRTTAVAGATRVALATERYRIDKGRFPNRLDQLVPDYLEAVPVDPFDDKPLRYRVTDDAVIIYSIGEDGVDDGGYVTHRTAPETSPTDWGFVLLKPEFRGRPASTTAPATQGAEAASASTGPA